MVRRVNVTSKVKHFRCGAEAKASLNRAYASLSCEFVVFDPKPGDLAMSRLK